MKGFPKYIESRIKHSHPNKVIPVYNGEITLVYRRKKYTSNGQINYEWFPYPRLTIDVALHHDINGLNYPRNYDVIVMGVKIGKSSFRKGSLTSENVITKFYGDIPEAVFGDKSINTTKISFNVVNLKDIRTMTSSVKWKSKGYYEMTERLLLKDNKYIINIDKRLNYDDHLEKLKYSGGYYVLYNGSITKTANKAISFRELEKLRTSLKYFLSWISGNYVTLPFFLGEYKKETLWTEYRSVPPEQFSNNYSWVVSNRNEEISTLWVAYRKFTSNSDNSAVFHKLITWYIEANNRNGNNQSAMLLSQSALELVYNKIIVEDKGIIIGDDSQKISASNKLRLVLNELKEDRQIPPKYIELKSFQDSFSELKDAIDTIVYIRNCIVHSNYEKRLRLDKLNDNVIKQAKNISLWYLELSMLFMLQFKGEVNNRHRRSIKDRFIEKNYK